LGKRDDAQLFGQSRTLRIKQLLGLACSMANLDLTAPSTDILLNPTMFIPFRGPAGPAKTSCGNRPEQPAIFVGFRPSSSFVTYGPSWTGTWVSVTSSEPTPGSLMPTPYA
jgi:hypothetical protein